MIIEIIAHKEPEDRLVRLAKLIHLIGPCLKHIKSIEDHKGELIVHCNGVFSVEKNFDEFQACVHEAWVSIGEQNSSIYFDTDVVLDG